MRGWRVGIAVVGLMCSAGWLSTAVTAAEPGKTHVAVLGQVVRPGTYALSRADIHELLTAAGGLTAESTQNVRIIRNGRGLTKVFVSPSVSYPLRDGDVILAESGNTNRGASRLARTPDSAIVTGQAPKSEQEIAPRTTFAALGLKPWPVVLSLPADESSAQAFLRAVNHPARGKVTVINSYGVPLVEEVAEKAIPLAPDSVIVLPKGLIDPSLLPALPEPEEASAPVAPPARVAPPVPGASQALEADAVIASASPKLPGLEQVPVPPPEPPIEIEPGPAPVDEVPADIDETPSPADAIPQPHEPLRAESSVSWWVRLRTPVVFIGATSLFLAILTALSSLGRPAAERPRAQQPEKKVAPPARPVASKSAVLIDRLILNQLPIQEECPVFPAGLTLHGQPAGSTRRTDAAQPVAEPHFPSEAPPRPEPVVVTQKKPVRVDRPGEPRRSALDRALATVNKAETR